jgi:hypothetical protein
LMGYLVTKYPFEGTLPTNQPYQGQLVIARGQMRV